jgi:ANTAR domain-containing protein
MDDRGDTVELTQTGLQDLMANILAGMAQDLPWMLGADITAYRDDAPIVFAAYGVGSALQDTQLYCGTGPTRDAAHTDGPVTSDNLWNDRRWQTLDVDRACGRHPEHARVLQRVCGAAALPGLQDDSGLVVLSVYLGAADTEDALNVMSRYERLITADVAALSAATGPDQRTGRVLAALQQRDVIEQAKGVVMATCRTDPMMAWMLLQDACRRAGTNLQALAAELVMEVRAAPGPPDEDSAPRRAAEELWSALRRIQSAGI